MINEKIWKPWQLGRTQAMFRKYMKRKETQYEKDKKDARNVGCKDGRG